MPANLENYQNFLKSQVDRLGSFQFDTETLLWHYTNGPGLLGILSSGTIYSTQVSCLNDSSEIRYGQVLFQKALTESIASFTGDDRVKQFAVRYLKLIEEAATLITPPHAPSPFFVTCFSSEEDDLSTWRAYGPGQKGYAIAFKANRLFNSPNALLKVNYDAKVHKELATEVVAATLKFYEEGLQGKQPQEIAGWDEEFIQAWESKVTYLSPLVKDPGFKAENEYRTRVSKTRDGIDHCARLGQPGCGLVDPPAWRIRFPGSQRECTGAPTEGCTDRLRHTNKHVLAAQ